MHIHLTHAYNTQHACNRGKVSYYNYIQQLTDFSRLQPCRLLKCAVKLKTKVRFYTLLLLLKTGSNFGDFILFSVFSKKEKPKENSKKH